MAEPLPPLVSPPMPELPPIMLEPILVPKPWGGRRLEALGKRLGADVSYGEAWEVADLPEGVAGDAPATRTLVSSGGHAGASLRDLIALYGERLMGSASPTSEGDFPLLVKVLDAREHLSVQVHPDEAYVARNPAARRKTESWFVVDAEPDAVLYLGLDPEVTRDDLAAAAGSTELAELLCAVPAEPGAFHHLPAGIVHALGAGVMVAEIQTPSDTTFRLYDWAEEYGRAPRDLHIDAALEVALIGPPDDGLAPFDGSGNRPLVDTADYWIREHAESVDLDGHAEVRVLMVVRGECVIRAPGAAPLEGHPGTTVVLPAEIASTVEVEAGRDLSLLEVGLVDRQAS